MTTELGLRIVWSPTIPAWLVLDNDELIATFADRGDAYDYVRDLRRGDRGNDEDVDR